MREYPILFSAPMVRALLDGRKTQTRRLVKPQPMDGWLPEVGPYCPTMVDKDGECYPGDEIFGASDENEGRKSPFGRPGDRLWVRETWDFRSWATPPTNPNDIRIAYGADGEQKMLEAPASWHPTVYNYERWRPSIHMPRWASRLTLEITDVRVQRLQGLTESDALAEGIIPDEIGKVASLTLERIKGEKWPGPVLQFAYLWGQIYGEESWDENPWVWAVSFKRV